MTKLYKYPIALTQQFKFCGNPFRIDTYKGCSFGCIYCFASTRGGNYKFNLQIADLSIVKNYFIKAFEKTNIEYKNITVELLRHRVPLHLGGLSEPFQHIEFKIKNTLKFLKFSAKYSYPILISTKTDNLPDEYFEILNPKYHAFQISLISMDERFIRIYEHNTPSPENRINFIKKLKSKGFWVSLRLQPLIDIDEAIRLIKNIQKYIDYITIEHIKIPVDNKKIREYLFQNIPYNLNDFYSTGREYELRPYIKLNNIRKIKKYTNLPIGIGDNDLHEYSDSLNCCGLDRINKNFNNWLKYNSMYIRMTGDKNVWFPKNNCSFCLNSSCKKKGFNFKDYVDDYMRMYFKDNEQQLNLNFHLTNVKKFAINNI